MRPLRLILAASVSLCILATGASAQDAQMPNYYSEPGLNPNRDYANQHFGEHIDPFTGKLQHHYTEIFIPGNGGFDLKVQRSYTSVEDTTVDISSPVGLGWTLHFGRVISVTSNCEEMLQATVNKGPVLELPDGSRQLFAVSVADPTILISTDRWRMTCQGQGGYIVTSPEGTTYEMTQFSQVTLGVSVWLAAKITDKNGNFMTLAYNINATQGPVVTSVTTNDGRQVTFSYTAPGDGSFRLTSISTNTAPAQTYTYSYTNDPSGVSNNFFLTRVTRPTGDAWIYDYNYSGQIPGRYAMTRATYPQGGSISYQYAFVDQMGSRFRATVLSTKTTSDGSWTFAYAPSSGVFGVPDTTTVNAPNGHQYVYEHVGFNSISSGSVWSIGLLTRKTLKTNGVTLQTETYTWDKQMISTQDNARPQLYLSSGIIPVDNEYDAPILVSKTITRDGSDYTTNYSSFDVHGNPGAIDEVSNVGEAGLPRRSVSRTYCVNTAKWILHNAAVETISSNGSPIGSVTRTYDTTCTNMISENRFGVTTSYAYFASGDLQSKTDARGIATSYSSYNRGMPQTESQPDLITISRTINAAGNVVSETNGEGATTSYAFDALNRVTSIDHPIGNDVSIAWTSTTRTLTRGSFQHIQTVDGYGRITQISAGPVGGTKIVKILRYNALGQKTFESAPGTGSASLAGMQYAYDVLDRPTSIQHLDTSGAPAATRTFVYSSGNAVSITDERGNVTQYKYLSFGNPDEGYLIGITPPAATGASTTIGRNVLGRITSVSQGTAGVGTGVVTRTYGYDSRFYLTSIADPETGTTGMGRDAIGNMISRNVGASGATSFTYDGHSRVTSIGYPNPARNVIQTWNKNSELVSANNAASTRTWTYDANENMTREDLSVGGNTFSLIYGYDLNDQLNQITYPNSSGDPNPRNVVTYSPDVFGRPTAASPFVTSVTHFANGQINTMAHSNGVTTTMSQDSRLRPSLVQTTKAASNYINLAYGYDPANNIASISDTANPDNNRTLTYDGIDRLASVNGFGISYDGASNILQQNFGSTLNYAYDGQNRLASTSGRKAYVFAYDVYGNVTNNGATTFQYDDASNLLCVNCASPSKVEYDYDAKGMRVLTRKNGATTYSMYGANGLLMFEYEPASNLFRQHFYLKGSRVATRVLTVPFATATSLTASSSQVRPGQSVILTATVSGQSPTGTVTFSDNGTVIGTATLAGGTASFTTAGLSFGLHNFTASYGGDANNAASNTNTAPTVVMAGTNSSTSMTASASQVPSGQTVALTATISGDAPTGTVTFLDNGASIGSAAVANGTASLTTAALLIGTHRFTASYGGDVNNSPSSTASATVVTAGTMSSTSLATSSAKVQPGQTVTLTANISGQTPTGTVNFFDNGALIGGVALTGGAATFTTAALRFGVHAFTASYGGDANNFSSTSSGVVVTAGNVDALIEIFLLLMDD